MASFGIPMKNYLGAMAKQEEKNPWQITSKETRYESPWIEVLHHEVVTPGGNPGIYGMVRFKHLAIGIIPIDGEGNTTLVGQYRFPNEEYSWEIPEGGGKLDEPPLEAAKRELREECGLLAKEWTCILEMRLSNSVSDEIAYVFVAKDLSSTNRAPDDTEDLQIKAVPFSEALEMVMNGTITDSMSVAGILKADKLFRENKL